MQYNAQLLGFELICIIVNHGLGTKALKILKKHGVTGGTILIGKGTVNHRILDLLAITDTRKEIVLAIANRSIVENALQGLSKIFDFQRKNQGIIFTTSVCSVAGSSSCRCSSETINEEQRSNHAMYQAITVIVDKGNAEEVVSVAYQAGTKGATIINARGAGIHETSKVFFMEIEPEKEIVLILCEANKTELVVAAIREKMRIDEPGKGIIYVQDVGQTFGIYK